MMLLKVLPRQTIHNFTNMAMPHAILSPKFIQARFSFSILLTNGSDDVVSKLGISMSFTRILGSMNRLVGHVALLGVPSKVLGSVVVFIAIIMTGFHSFGTRTDERLQDKLVEQSIFVSHTDKMVSALHLLGSLPLPSITGDTSLVWTSRLLEASPERAIGSGAITKIAGDDAILNCGGRGKIVRRHGPAPVSGSDVQGERVFPHSSRPSFILPRMEIK